MAISSMLHQLCMANINSTWPLSCTADITPHRIGTAPQNIASSLQTPPLPFAIATNNKKALQAPATDTHLPSWMRPPAPVVVGLIVFISCQEQEPLNWGGGVAPNPTILSLLHPTCCPLLQWGKCLREMQWPPSLSHSKKISKPLSHGAAG